MYFARGRAGSSALLVFVLAWTGLQRGARAGNQDLYWTDYSSGLIQRSALDGTGVETIIPGLDHPYGLAYDPTRQKLYWMDGGIFPMIHSANLDGSGVTTLFSVAFTGAQSLAFDPVSARLFWVAHPSGGPIGLMSANLDGTNATQIITGQSAPEGVSVDALNRKVYWTDITRETVSRANLNGTGLEDIIADQRFTGGIVGITVDPANSQLFFGASTSTNFNTDPPTVTGGIQRAGLDGSAIAELQVISSTYQAFAVDDSTAKVFWADSQAHVIKSSNFDGTQVQTVHSGAGFQPYGLVIAPVPEPAALTLLAMGTAGMVLTRRRCGR